jgi:hypothetical protein
MCLSFDYETETQNRPQALPNRFVIILEKNLRTTKTQKQEQQQQALLGIWTNEITSFSRNCV